MMAIAATAYGAIAVLAVVPRAERCFGVTRGNPRLHEARKNAVGAVKAEADRYAANVIPIIREAQKAGARKGNRGRAERQRDRHGTRRAVVRAERREHP